MKRLLSASLILIACAETPSAPAASTSPPASSTTPSVEVVSVLHEPLDVAITFPGELRAFQSVDLRARTDGFVQRIDVDRGSIVHAGEILVRLAAPELRSRRTSAEARLRGQHSTSDRLRAAAATPGAIAGHDIELASSQEDALAADVQSLSTLESYLVVRAPFDGIVSERFVDPGALVGPTGEHPLLHLEQIDHLRVVVSVPEYAVGHIEDGRSVTFHVRAFPGRAFTGLVARAARAVDPATRTMPVELDADNADGALAPGMYADVEWHVTREAPSFLVPSRAVVQSTSASFVVAVREGHAHRIAVERGLARGELTEVFGELAEGDVVLARGRDDIADGSTVTAHAIDAGVRAP